MAKNKVGEKATWYQAVERCKKYDGLHTSFSFKNLSMTNITENIWVANTLTYRNSSKSPKTYSVLCLYILIDKLVEKPK